jgi:hypothetical protein
MEFIHVAGESGRKSLIVFVSLRSVPISISCNNVAMASQITKRNHYNPCFWTALWNERFFNDFCAGEKRGTPREQVVFTLNLRSNRIFETSVDALYYDKDACVAPITPESVLGFCQRYFPDRLAELQKSIIEHPETLYLDFEATLSGIEGLDGYDAIMRAAKCGGLESTVH